MFMYMKYEQVGGLSYMLWDINENYDNFLSVLLQQKQNQKAEGK